MYIKKNSTPNLQMQHRGILYKIGQDLISESLIQQISSGVNILLRANKLFGRIINIIQGRDGRSLSEIEIEQGIYQFPIPELFSSLKVLRRFFLLLEE